MSHGGDIYSNKVNIDFSVSLNPFVRDILGNAFDDMLSEAAERAFKRAGAYPDPKFEGLRDTLAKAEGVNADEIVPGNGASEVLLSAIRSLDPKNVLLPVPCFTGYEHILKGIRDCKINRFYLKEPFDIDEDLVSFISGSKDDIDLMILTDPGNPTGKNIDENILEELLKVSTEKGIKIILDESFYYLSKKGAQKKENRVRKLISGYGDLIIIRSFTKLFALPGIRMGYAIADKVLADKIKDHQPEWNLSVLHEEIMNRLCGLATEDYINRSYRLISRERDRFYEELKRKYEKVCRSDSVYITFKAQNDLYQKMLENGILIRDLSDVSGLGQGYYRVAVRKEKEQGIFLRIG